MSGDEFRLAIRRLPNAGDGFPFAAPRNPDGRPCADRRDLYGCLDRARPLFASSKHFAPLKGTAGPTNG